MAAYSTCAITHKPCMAGQCAACDIAAQFHKEQIIHRDTEFILREGGVPLLQTPKGDKAMPDCDVYARCMGCGHVFSKHDWEMLANRTHCNKCNGGVYVEQRTQNTPVQRVSDNLAKKEAPINTSIGTLRKYACRIEHLLDILEQKLQPILAQNTAKETEVVACPEEPTTANPSRSQLEEECDAISRTLSIQTSRIESVIADVRL